MASDLEAGGCLLAELWLGFPIASRKTLVLRAADNGIDTVALAKVRLGIA